MDGTEPLVHVGGSVELPICDILQSSRARHLDLELKPSPGPGPSTPSTSTTGSAVQPFQNVSPNPKSYARTTSVDSGIQVSREPSGNRQPEWTSVVASTTNRAVDVARIALQNFSSSANGSQSQSPSQSDRHQQQAVVPRPSSDSSRRWTQCSLNIYVLLFFAKKLIVTNVSAFCMSYTVWEQHVNWLSYSI